MTTSMARLLVGAAFVAVAACSGGGGGGSLITSGSPTPTPSPSPSPSPSPTPSPTPVQTVDVPDPAPEGDDFHPEGMGWTLAWSDEFDGDALDPTRWAPEESCWGGGNNERQCYTDREDNIDVVNGLLRLIALKERFTGPEYPAESNSSSTKTQDYTSGKVRTRGLHDWKYGRFSARMKAPEGQGTWPAFWMMPIEDHYGGWPLSGEIDVMETVNLGVDCSDCEGSLVENRVHGTIHFGDSWPNNRMNGGTAPIPVHRVPDDGYHVYSVEWGEGRIQWFVDGELYHRADSGDWFTAAANAAGNPNAPFDRNFFVMLNFAVGGAFPENTGVGGFDPDAFPSQLLVDWVRVYQCSADLETGRACMDESALE